MSEQYRILRFYAPDQGALSNDARLTSDVCLPSVCLSSVCRAHPVGGRRVWPAGWDGAYWLIGPGTAGLAEGCRCALPLQAWAGAYCSGLPHSLFYRATVCVSVVLAVGVCPSVCPSVRRVRVLYPNA